MRNRGQRFAVTLAAVLIGIAGGASIGYLLGRILTLREAEHRLSANASDAVRQMDAEAAGVRGLLAAMNASPYAACSESELNYFRNLVYQSSFLKDSGRMRDGRIECSAIVGTAAAARAPGRPGVRESDGITEYWDLPAFRIGKEPMIAAQAGSSYVVSDSQVRRDGMPAYIHMDVRPAGAVAAKNSEDTRGSQLFTQCSTRYSHCVTASMTNEDALRADLTQFIAVIALSALAGGAFGMLWSFAYRRNRSMEQQLQRAIARDELQVVYQPVVNLATGRVTGAEALARWTDDDGFAVSPDVFIRIAEERCFVGDITRLVVERALRDSAGIIQQREDFHVSVNVAAADLSDPHFLPMLDAAFAHTGVPRQNVIFELTETCTARRETAIATIFRLRMAGHEVHIDDFGTGFSSLSYLNDLSVDAIKIDRSFTKAIGTAAVKVAILPQILSMAESLNLQVVVEGIETLQQAVYFAAAGLPMFGQGWFFGRPVPVETLRSLLADGAECVDDKSCEEDTSFALPAGAS